MFCSLVLSFFFFLPFPIKKEQQSGPARLRPLWAASWQQEKNGGRGWDVYAVAVETLRVLPPMRGRNVPLAVPLASVHATLDQPYLDSPSVAVPFDHVNCGVVAYCRRLAARPKPVDRMRRAGAVGAETALDPRGAESPHAGDSFLGPGLITRVPPFFLCKRRGDPQTPAAR